ncbi:phage tail sheath subtilisin-like domain-containing protein [Streptomyces sp. NPDC005355]|uniref:phage tail sheath family protein n=1 Tax=Streptomyces sp. NPDC005355 TaxID=3157038 RepID=UPI0033A620E0
MVDYTNKAPGVYIEEIEPAGPIAGIGTSTAALIGTPKRLDDADVGKPRQVTNWTAYTSRFDGYQESLWLPHAVHGFFENGGTLAYVVPVQDLTTGLEAALDQLTRLSDVSLVCLPGEVGTDPQKKVIAHCEQMGDRIAILDGVNDATDLIEESGPLLTQRGEVTSDDGFAALYWPWITISDPLTPRTEDTVTVPPSGHIAGIMARSDSQRGVHKAPANEPIRGALDLAYPLNNVEQGKLNRNNINALRRFPGRPPLVWGARTTTTGTVWRYVNVRRLISYIEASLLQGLRWAVFEPNNTALWKGLERSITEFLNRVWQSGALFGRTAKEAFYVKIDEELNPPAVRELGQVFIEIGVAPTRPAEHVVLRLGLWAGGARISEG